MVNIIWPDAIDSDGTKHHILEVNIFYVTRDH